MVESNSLEQNLLMSVSSFASEHGLSYLIRKNNLINGNQCFGITMGVPKRNYASDKKGQDRNNPSEIEESTFDMYRFFEHSILIDKQSGEIKEHTDFVDYNINTGTSSRKIYLGFISYMTSQGILLTNGFEKLWRDNPESFSL